jgi:release factor glutamine methyltransferase
VTPEVLIPRPDTELVVELALQRLRAEARVLDVGTGSGAIALAIKHSRPDCTVVAIDVSFAAAGIARRNAAKLGLDVDVRVGDWFDAVHAETFDAIVSNPPYVREGDPHLDMLVSEPRLALVAGADGLAALRVVVRDAFIRLAPRGVLIVEHGFDQGADVRVLFEARGYGAIATHRDAAGHERATLGSR